MPVTLVDAARIKSEPPTADVRLSSSKGCYCHCEGLESLIRRAFYSLYAFDEYLLDIWDLASVFNTDPLYAIPLMSKVFLSSLRLLFYPPLF
jgi:hypothetical protein